MANNKNFESILLRGDIDSVRNFVFPLSFDTTFEEHISEFCVPDAQWQRVNILNLPPIESDYALFIARGGDSEIGINFSQKVTNSTGFPDLSRVIIDGNFICRGYKTVAPDPHLIPLAVIDMFDCSDSPTLFADGANFRLPMARAVNVLRSITDLNQLVDKLPYGLQTIIVDDKFIRNDDSKSAEEFLKKIAKTHPNLKLVGAKNKNLKLSLKIIKANRAANKPKPDSEPLDVFVPPELSAPDTPKIKDEKIYFDRDDVAKLFSEPAYLQMVAGDGRINDKTLQIINTLIEQFGLPTQNTDVLARAIQNAFNKTPGVKKEMLQKTANAPDKMACAMWENGISVIVNSIDDFINRNGTRVTEEEQEEQQQAPTAADVQAESADAAPTEQQKAPTADVPTKKRAIWLSYQVISWIKTLSEYKKNAIIDQLNQFSKPDFKPNDRKHFEIIEEIAELKTIDKGGLRLYASRQILPALMIFHGGDKNDQKHTPARQRSDKFKKKYGSAKQVSEQLSTIPIDAPTAQIQCTAYINGKEKTFTETFYNYADPNLQKTLGVEPVIKKPDEINDGAWQSVVFTQPKTISQWAKIYGTSESLMELVFHQIQMENLPTLRVDADAEHPDQYKITDTAFVDEVRGTTVNMQKYITIKQCEFMDLNDFMATYYGDFMSDHFTDINVAKKFVQDTCDVLYASDPALANEYFYKLGDMVFFYKVENKNSDFMSEIIIPALPSMDDKDQQKTDNVAPKQPEQESQEVKGSDNMRDPDMKQERKLLYKWTQRYKKQYPNITDDWMELVFALYPKKFYHLRSEDHNGNIWHTIGYDKGVETSPLDSYVGVKAKSLIPDYEIASEYFKKYGYDTKNQLLDVLRTKCMELINNPKNATEYFFYKSGETFFFNKILIDKATGKTRIDEFITEYKLDNSNDNGGNGGNGGGNAPGDVPAPTEKSDIDQEPRQTVPEKLLFTPISDLGLSLRTQNCLEKAGIEFICDLIQYSKSDFKNIHGLGPKGYHSIVSYLLPQLGLGLDMKLSDESLRAIDAFKSFPVDIDNLKLNIRKTNLLTRTKNCLLANGIDTINKLINTTKEDLYKIQGFGRRSMFDIEYMLEEMGLKLAATTEKPDLSKILIQDLRSLKCAKNPLIANDIDTVDKLITKTKDELYKIKGFGRMAMTHVTEYLDKMGLHLAEPASVEEPAPVEPVAEPAKKPVVTKGLVDFIALSTFADEYAKKVAEVATAEQEQATAMADLKHINDQIIESATKGEYASLAQLGVRAETAKQRAHDAEQRVEKTKQELKAMEKEALNNGTKLVEELNKKAEEKAKLQAAMEKTNEDIRRLEELQKKLKQQLDSHDE